MQSTTQSITSGQSFHQLPKRQLIGTIIGLQLTLLLAALDQTIVSTAMPKIIQSLNAFDRYAWVTTAYMLTSTASVPVFGKLSDLYGRKPFLIGGATLFILASALCGMSGLLPPIFGDGMSQLVIFRALQGIAGGVIMALTFTVIADIFPPAERGKYQGLFSGVFALASVVGPLAGGWLTDCFSWRWVFYINLPVGIGALVTLIFAFPNIKPMRSKPTIDYLGAATLICFLVPFLIAVTQAVALGWTASSVVGMLVASVLAFFVFIYVEMRAKEPIIPLPLFKNPVIAISAASLFLTGIGMFGSILFIPLFMQSVNGLSATKSGSLLTPMMLMMTVTSIVSGQLISRLGRYKIIALCGLSIMTTGMFLFSRMGIETTDVEVIRDMMIVGAGLGLLMPLYTLVVQNATEKRFIGAITASTQFFRSVGGTIGAAVFGSIMLSNYNQYLVSNAPANIPPKLLDYIHNPMEQAKFHQILAINDAHSSKIITMLQTAIKMALVHAIDRVFLIATILIGIAFLLNFFLKDIPLRKTHDEASKSEKVQASS